MSMGQLGVFAELAMLKRELARRPPRRFEASTASSDSPADDVVRFE